jgi:hypothetical protein
MLKVAKRRILITYQELANVLEILPPQSIHRVTVDLERVMEEDAVADRPFIAALVCQEPSWNENMELRFDLAINSENFS